MKAEEKLMESQANLMKEVYTIAASLDQSTEYMKDIASNLTASSNEQASYIGEIQMSIDQFAQSTDECLNVSIKSSESSINSAKVLSENAKNMEKMQDAMKEIEIAASHISSIIKQWRMQITL